MNPPLPQPVVVAMARREYRMHHLLWHEIRRFWNQYPGDVQEKIRELGWEPPRPARDENEAPILTNDSGEDFFYMHRQLIGRVNRILTEVGDPNYPQVEGWVRLPGPDDPDYPVPPPWFDPGALPIRNRYVSRIKTDVVFEKHFKHWEKTFTDPVFLRSVTLGMLGALVDYFLVDPVRRRWAAAPGATRPDAGPVDAATIPTEWDDPRYEYLGDYYSMHVNPIHWRFVGWIDDRVEEWKLANGVFGSDFWKGTWVGKLPDVQPMASQSLSAGSPAPEPAADLTAMEELITTIARTGLSSMRTDVGLDLHGADAPPAAGHGRGGHGDGGHGDGGYAVRHRKRGPRG